MRPAMSGLIKCALLSLAVFSQPLVADYFKLSVGTEYISGDFGGDTSIHEWYLPVTGKYVTDKYIFRITVPWLRLTAPAGSTLSGGSDSQLIDIGSGERLTEQGLGDIIASMTYKDVLDNEAATSVSLDITGKIKFATADQSRGLGTGENDYSILATLLKSSDRFSPYAALGYTFRGDLPGTDLANVWSVMAGGMIHLTPKLSAGLDYYFREASTITASNQKELTALLNFKLSRDEALHWYVLRGLDDGSPDWGMGAIFSVIY